jgi:hypothetical protein
MNGIFRKRRLVLIRSSVIPAVVISCSQILAQSVGVAGREKNAGKIDRFNAALDELI